MPVSLKRFPTAAIVLLRMTIIINNSSSSEAAQMSDINHGSKTITGDQKMSVSAKSNTVGGVHTVVSPYKRPSGGRNSWSKSSSLRAMKHRSRRLVRKFVAYMGRIYDDKVIKKQAGLPLHTQPATDSSLSITTETQKMEFSGLDKLDSVKRNIDGIMSPGKRDAAVAKHLKAVAALRKPGVGENVHPNPGPSFNPMGKITAPPQQGASISMMTSTASSAPWAPRIAGGTLNDAVCQLYRNNDTLALNSVVSVHSAETPRDLGVLVMFCFEFDVTNTTGYSSVKTAADSIYGLFAANTAGRRNRNLVMLGYSPMDANDNSLTVPCSIPSNWIIGCWWMSAGTGSQHDAPGLFSFFSGGGSRVPTALGSVDAEPLAVQIQAAAPLDVNVSGVSGLGPSVTLGIVLVDNVPLTKFNSRIFQDPADLVGLRCSVGQSAADSALGWKVRGAIEVGGADPATSRPVAITGIPTIVDSEVVNHPVDINITNTIPAVIPTSVVAIAEQQAPLWVADFRPNLPPISQAVLAVEADAHNAAMHATNGNISYGRTTAVNNDPSAGHVGGINIGLTGVTMSSINTLYNTGQPSGWLAFTGGQVKGSVRTYGITSIDPGGMWIIIEMKSAGYTIGNFAIPIYDATAGAITNFDFTIPPHVTNTTLIIDCYADSSSNGPSVFTSLIGYVNMSVLLFGEAVISTSRSVEDAVTLPSGVVISGINDQAAPVWVSKYDPELPPIIPKSDLPLALALSVDTGASEAEAAAHNALMHATNGNIVAGSDGYSEYLKRSANRRAHSLNGNSAAGMLPTYSDMRDLTTATNQGATQNWSTFNVEKCASIADCVSGEESALLCKPTEKELNHEQIIMSTMVVDGALASDIRRQALKYQGLRRITRILSNRSVQSEGYSGPSVTCLLPRSFYLSSTWQAAVGSFDIPTRETYTYPLNLGSYREGGGVALADSPILTKLQQLAKTDAGLSFRVTAVQQQTSLYANELLILASDQLGIDAVNMEEFAFKLALQIERLSIVDKSKKISDVCYSALSGNISGGYNDLTFTSDRSNYPADEVCGYVGGTGALTPTPLCGKDTYISLHTTLQTIFAPNQNTSYGGQPSNVPVPLPARIMGCLGPDQVGKVIAIVASCLAPANQVPIGINGSNKTMFTHFAETIRLDGLTNIQFLCPVVGNKSPNVGSVAESTQSAMYVPSFGGRAVTNGNYPYYNTASYTPPPTMGTNMLYVGRDDIAASSKYSLTALWASYMASSNPITILDVLTVRDALNRYLPIMKPLSWCTELLRTRSWVFCPPTVAADSDTTLPTIPNYCYFDGSQPPVTSNPGATSAAWGNDAVFTLFKTQLKPLAYMLAGLKTPVQTGTSDWGSMDDMHVPRNINTSNPYYNMYGWATVTALAAAAQMYSYVVGIAGSVYSAYRSQLYSEDVKSTDAIRNFDGSFLQAFFNLNAHAGELSRSQVALEQLYAFVTGGCKVAGDQSGLNLFSRRLIPYALFGSYAFANGTYCPGALSIADFALVLDKPVREYAPFPAADVLNRVTYLRYRDRNGGVTNMRGITDPVGAKSPMFPMLLNAAMQQQLPVGQAVYCDSVIQYNQDLWYGFARDNGYAVTVLSGNSSVLLPGQTPWLYSRRAYVDPGESWASHTYSVECRGMLPRRAGPWYVNLYSTAAGMPTNPVLLSQYAQGVAQPRNTWMLYAYAARPTNIYTLAPVIAEGLDHILSGSIPRSQADLLASTETTRNNLTAPESQARADVAAAGSGNVATTAFTAAEPEGSGIAIPTAMGGDSTMH